MKKLTLLILTLISALSLTAQTPGTLYHLFGDNGIVLTDYDTENSYSYASVLQDDMKIVLGGMTDYQGAAGWVFNIMITRYNSYGTIDIGFANNGIKVLEFGGSDDYLTDIGIQADGKIVGVGHFTQDNKTKMLAFRLNTDGSLDNSFDGDGMATIDFGEGVNAYGMSLGICDDGKIVISGYVQDTVFSYSEIAMCKLLPSGILDIDFGYFGLITYEEADLFHFPDELVIHNDRIILGGISANADFDKFAVISGYHLNGEIDFSFGDGGYRTVMIEGGLIAMGGASYNGMCVAHDGKILYTCEQRSGWLDYDFALLRLTPNGNIDYSFGVNGLLVTPMDENSYANDVITQADGKIIACGYYLSPDPGGSDFLIIRYLENGELDPSFGSDGTGIVITNISTEIQWYQDKSYNLMFCNSDRLLVSGYGTSIDGWRDFAMACYHTGLSVDITEPEGHDESLIIYPNPAQEKIHISIPAGEVINEINIYNITGQKVTQQVGNSENIDISDLAEGIYLLKARLTNSSIEGKLVIKR